MGVAVDNPHGIAIQPCTQVQMAHAGVHDLVDIVALVTLAILVRVDVARSHVVGSGDADVGDLERSGKLAHPVERGDAIAGVNVGRADGLAVVGEVERIVFLDLREFRIRATYDLNLPLEGCLALNELVFVLFRLAQVFERHVQPRAYVLNVIGAVFLRNELPLLVRSGALASDVDDLAFLQIGFIVFRALHIEDAIAVRFRLGILEMLVEIEIVAVVAGLLQLELRGLAVVVQVGYVLGAVSVIVD